MVPIEILANFEYLPFLNCLGIGLNIRLPNGLFCLFIKQAELVLKKKTRTVFTNKFFFGF